MQSATLTIQQIHKKYSSWLRFWRAILHELQVALCLGLTCALVTGLIVYFWKGHLIVALVICGSLFLSLMLSCFWGVIIPYTFHFRNRDPHVASAPLALALSDLTALLVYFTLAERVLR